MSGVWVKQQGRDDRVDADRLARAGGAGDEQVGHLAQIGHGRLARGVLSQRDLERAGDLAEGVRLQHAAQRDQRLLGVGDLEAHQRPARHGRFDADRRGRKSQGQVVGQCLDPGDLDLDPLVLLDLVVHHLFDQILGEGTPGGAIAALLEDLFGLAAHLVTAAPPLAIAGLQAKLRHCRAGVGLDHPHRQAKVRQGLLDDARPFLDVVVADLDVLDIFENLGNGGQAPGACRRR